MCLVVRGHETYVPDVVTYFSMVDREMVHIALTLAVLHDFHVKAADVLNAYVTVPNKEKVWTVVVPEFEDDVGMIAIF